MISFAKTQQLGYVSLTRNTNIPKTFEEANILLADKGPINTQVEKPFRTWRSSLDNLLENKEDAALQAFQKLLLAAISTVRGSDKLFVLYVDLVQEKMDSELVGKVYKVGK